MSLSTLLKQTSASYSLSLCVVFMVLPQFLIDTLVCLIVHSGLSDQTVSFSRVGAMSESVQAPVNVLHPLRGSISVGWMDR